MHAEQIELQRLLRITTVYSTHDQVEAMALADRIAVMHDGGVEQVGTADLLRAHPATEMVARFMSEDPGRGLVERR